VGERIGLHPLTVIFALMAFGELFGFTGILMALPVSAVMSVGVKLCVAITSTVLFIVSDEQLLLDLDTQILPSLLPSWWGRMRNWRSYWACLRSAQSVR
jgi:hypothetical protein